MVLISALNHRLLNHYQRPTAFCRMSIRIRSLTAHSPSMNSHNRLNKTEHTNFSNICLYNWGKNRALQILTGVGYFCVTLTLGTTRLQKICSGYQLHEQWLPARASSCVSIDVSFTGPPHRCYNRQKTLVSWGKFFSQLYKQMFGKLVCSVEEVVAIHTLSTCGKRQRGVGIGLGGGWAHL